MSDALRKTAVKKITGALLMVAMLFPISSILADNSSAQKSGGILRIGSQSNILPLDPFHTHETISVHLLDLVFNKLVRLNSAGEIEPDLAQKWTISDDGKTYTFQLRDEIYFHDKKPFSSRDVLQSYEWCVSSKVKSPRADIFNTVESVTAPDDKTVVIRLQKPHAPFLYKLKDFYIVSRAAVPDEEEISFLEFGKKPVGTGPFQFHKWVGDKILSLRFYPYYHEGRAKLDEIRIFSFPSAEEVWVALMREEVDMSVYMNRRDFEVVRKDPVFNAYSVPSSPYYYALAYNFRNPLLADKRFRLAVAHAINRKEIIDSVLGGFGTEANGPFLPGSWAEDPNVRPIAYDPEKAKALLAEMGWHDSDGDGVLDKDGEKLELSLMFFSSFDIREKIALMVRQHIQEIGIKVKLEKVENIEELGSARLKKSDFDIELRPVSAHPEPSLTLLEWHSVHGNFPHFYYFNNSELDNSIDQSSREIKEDIRKDYLIQSQRILSSEQYFTTLFYQNEFYAVKNNFEGTEQFFNFYTPYHTIKDWAQDTSARTGDRR